MRDQPVGPGTYGTFMFQVTVGNVGSTTVLPFTIWMPALDTEHAIQIPVPTTKEIVATTPRIPGLEIRIPAGIRIRDMDGNLVHTITITPIPRSARRFRCLLVSNSLFISVFSPTAR